MRRRIQLLVLGLVLLMTAMVWATPGPPLTTTDLGEGLVAEPEFDFKDTALAGQQLLAILDQSPDMAKHLRAIRAYQKRFSENGEAVPRLRDLVVGLRGSKRELAGVEAAFTIGLLIQDDAKETRAQYIKDLAPLVAGIRRNLPTEAWCHLVAAMLFGSFPELQGNWFDEALYAQSHGYDNPQVQLAVGSFLLTMDLSYGGNERLQWFIFLAFSRVQALMPGNEAWHVRIRNLVRMNLEIPGYRPSKWLKSLAAG